MLAKLFPDAHSLILRDAAKPAVGCTLQMRRATGSEICCAIPSDVASTRVALWSPVHRVAYMPPAVTVPMGARLPVSAAGACPAATALRGEGRVREAAAAIACDTARGWVR